MSNSYNKEIMEFDITQLSNSHYNNNLYKTEIEKPAKLGFTTP